MTVTVQLSHIPGFGGQYRTSWLAQTPVNQLSETSQCVRGMVVTVPKAEYGNKFSAYMTLLERNPLRQSVLVSYHTITRHGVDTASLRQWSVPSKPMKLPTPTGTQHPLSHSSPQWKSTVIKCAGQLPYQHQVWGWYGIAMAVVSFKQNHEISRPLTQSSPPWKLLS